MKRGQIWVETVIYTLIGLSLIGLVLAIVTPKINEYKDRTIIEQTIESLDAFDGKIEEILSAPGNVRLIEIRMKRGKLFFDLDADSVKYVIDDSRARFTEPDIPVDIGRIKVTTKINEEGKRNTVSLLLDYEEHDLTFDGDATGVKEFDAASIPYKFSVENKGLELGAASIDIKEIS